MAEVNKSKISNTKKSSKVLDNNTLTNDELLEQILNKKSGTNDNSGKRRSSIKTNNSVKKSRSNSTKKVIKEDFSPDELYEQIKFKKGSKKKKENTSKKNYEVSINDNIVEITAETPIPMVVEEDEIEKEITNSSIKSENNSIDDEIGTLTTNDSKKKNDDLIITREIRFDDLSKDLKNKKNLNDLREAIEEFDRLDDYEPVNDKINDDIELLPSIMYSNYKLKKLLVIILVVICVVLVIFGVVFLLGNGNFDFEESAEKDLNKNTLIEEKRKEEEKKAIII